MSDSDYPAIVAEAGGKQRRLVLAKQWRAAIANRQIDRDTMIHFERGPGQSARIRAGDCDVLQPLLDDILGPRPEPAMATPPEPEPESEPEPEPAADFPDPEPEPAVPPAPVHPREAENLPEPDVAIDDRTPSQADHDEIAHPRSFPHHQPNSNAKWISGVLIVAALGLAMIGFLSNSEDGSDYPASSASQTDAAQAAANVELPDASPTPEPAAQLYYTVQGVDVLDRPGGTASATHLTRNSEVRGVPYGTDGQWLKITEGTGQGGFVSLTRLSGKSRPMLTTATADDYFSTRRSEVFAAPDASSDAVGTIDAGTKMTIAGSVSGEFAEVQYEDRVRYVPWSAFGGEGGRGERHSLLVDNNCPYTMNVAFSLVVDGRRLNRGNALSYPPRAQDNLIYKGSRAKVYVDSTDLYYADLGTDFDFSQTITGSSRADQIFIDGDSREMKRIVPILGPNDEYRISFCR